MKITNTIAIILGLTGQCVMASDSDGFTTPRNSTSPTEVPAKPKKSKNPGYGYTARDLFSDDVPTERVLFPNSEDSDADDESN